MPYTVTIKEALPTKPADSLFTRIWRAVFPPKEVETTHYSQTVDTLNIPEIVKNINR